MIWWKKYKNIFAQVYFSFPEYWILCINLRIYHKKTSQECDNTSYFQSWIKLIKLYEETRCNRYSWNVWWSNKWSTYDLQLTILLLLLSDIRYAIILLIFKVGSSYLNLYNETCFNRNVTIFFLKKKMNEEHNIYK